MLDDELLAKADEVAGYKVLPPCAIYARIGAGGMGNVYKGRHLNLDIDVAVKVMKPELVLADPQFVARFRREGQSAAKICHQNVIRVYDVAEAHDLHYLIMEFVQGETARQRVERKGPLAVGEALQIVREAALGLGAAHKLGIVHRDVKPDNLLVSSDGEVKVADLGLAKPTVGGRSTSMLSSPNQIMGTPCYMPPEQWEGGAVTAAADVWALGATLWYLLVGREAISGDTPARIMSRIVLQPFPDVRELRPGVADEVVAVLTKATAKEAAHRYPTANELADAIEDLAIRRATLCDADAGSTELRTMLSPPPLKDLDQVKSWLREERGTRQNTPVRTPTPAPGTSDGSTMVRPVANGGTALRTPPDAGSTRVKTPPGGTVVATPAGAGKPVAIALAAAVLLVGGGVGWRLLRPEPTEPKTQTPAAQPVQPTPVPEAPKSNELPPKPITDAPKAPTQQDTPTTPPSEPKVEPKPEPKVEPKLEPKPPEPTLPFAEVERLLAAGELDAAIRAAEGITDPSLVGEKQLRLATLHARKAAELQRDGRLRDALDQLAKARGWRDSSALQQQRRDLTDTMARTAAERLVREQPTGPIARTDTVTFRGRLLVDFDVELRLGGERVMREADGSFRAMRTLGAGNAIAVAVAVEDSVTTLAPWRVEFVPDAAPVAPPVTPPVSQPSNMPVAPLVLPKPQPQQTPPSQPSSDAAFAFVGELDLPRTGGRVLTRTTTLRIAGKLSERDAELLVDGKTIAEPQWKADGSFAFTVMIAAEGRNQVTLRARKGDRETSTTFEVVRLTQPPTVKAIEPAKPSALATRVPQPIAVEADEWTDSVKAKSGSKTVDLQRAGTQWRGEVPLESGKNTIEITATNLAGLAGRTTFELEVRTARLAPGAVQLLGAGDPRRLDNNQTIYATAGAALDVTLEDGAWLLVDGQELPGRANRVPLQVAEGETRTFKLQACNGIGRSGPFTVKVIADRTPPVIAAAMESIDAKAGGEFELTGTWSDANGLRLLRIDGKPAIVDKNGTWRLKLPTPAQDTKVTITATDNAGNAATATVQVRVIKD